MTTFLGVPVVVRGEAYGNLYLTDKEGGEEFTESDEQLAVVLSEWAAIAIDNARLYENGRAAPRGPGAGRARARGDLGDRPRGRVRDRSRARARADRQARAGAMSEARSFLVLLQDGDRLRVAAAAGEVGSERGRNRAAGGGLAGRAPCADDRRR